MDRIVDMSIKTTSRRSGKGMPTGRGSRIPEGGAQKALGPSRKKSAYDRIHFATMALESGAKRLDISPRAMYRRLKKQDLIRQRLFRHYDLLHTQSLDYVAEDIAETLQNREAGK